MQLSKHPVTSKNGNTYKVDVYNDGWDYLVEIFKEKQVNTLFGKNKIKFINVFKSGYYIYPEWGYDFKGMAKHAVEKYESSLKEKRERNEKLESNIELFNEWDGKC
ncbi:hypothetical protein [Halalkalibacter oceani]|uniref:hypothetical protein n=1 Tax=Halalkalibacter oceani TaxID=1653776 RepID=UPI00339752A6